jgi:S-adenosylmethionine/arginine decarboxylase-like enzyme
VNHIKITASNSSSIVASSFVCVDTYLSHHYVAMDTSNCSTIPALSHLVTMYKKGNETVIIVRKITVMIFIWCS